MSVSIFDLLSIGVGPSSSHTIGPMRAGAKFVNHLKEKKLLNKINKLEIHLYGSLALTGKGHRTDMAVLMGVLGELPESIDPESIEPRLLEIKNTQKLYINNEKLINFNSEKDLYFHFDKNLPHHANGLEFIGYNGSEVILKQIYYSVGGGFIVNSEDISESGEIHQNNLAIHPLPYLFETAEQLLNHSKQYHLSIAEMMLQNEKVWRSEDQIKKGLLKIWKVMSDCIDRGCAQSGILPGGLKVKRRAPELKQKLIDSNSKDIMDWINLYALAVNEENAGGGVVVTAPTNGAAGIIPAVLRYHVDFLDGSEDSIINFLLTAGAIGILYKLGASISAAEVGCQGEVGVACSMAAAGLCAVMGGTVEQIENAAEIGMEHNLGLTCDPIAGLVQIPCIERNTMGSIQAVNAVKLALMGDGEHVVSLDQVIHTMRETGKDMMHKYKETALGGLAQVAGVSVSLPEC